jgi:hypothetical protein
MWRLQRPGIKKSPGTIVARYDAQNPALPEREDAGFGLLPSEGQQIRPFGSVSRSERPYLSCIGCPIAPLTSKSTPAQPEHIG